MEKRPTLGNFKRHCLPRGPGIRKRQSRALRVLHVRNSSRIHKMSQETPDSFGHLSCPGRMNTICLGQPSSSNKLPLTLASSGNFGETSGEQIGSGGGYKPRKKRATLSSSLKTLLSLRNFTIFNRGVFFVVFLISFDITMNQTFRHILCQIGYDFAHDLTATLRTVRSVCEIMHGRKKIN